MIRAMSPPYRKRHSTIVNVVVKSINVRQTTTMIPRRIASPILVYWPEISAGPVTGWIVALNRFLKCWPNGTAFEGCAAG